MQRTGTLGAARIVRILTGGTCAVSQVALSQIHGEVQVLRAQDELVVAPVLCDGPFVVRVRQDLLAIFQAELVDIAVELDLCAGRDVAGRPYSAEYDISYLDVGHRSEALRCRHQGFQANGFSQARVSPDEASAALQKGLVDEGVDGGLSDGLVGLLVAQDVLAEEAGVLAGQDDHGLPEVLDRLGCVVRVLRMELPDGLRGQHPAPAWSLRRCRAA